MSYCQFIQQGSLFFMCLVSVVLENFTYLTFSVMYSVQYQFDCIVGLDTIFMYLQCITPRM